MMFYLDTNAHGGPSFDATQGETIMAEFVPFPKIARLSREVVVTEKIDGTNAQICVNDDMTDIVAGSRSRWITPVDDNFGFARWAQDNKQELLKLGPGSHFGELLGAGVHLRDRPAEQEPLQRPPLLRRRYAPCMLP